MIAWAKRHAFLLMLGCVLLVGSVGHAPLRPIAETLPRDAIVFSILLAMSARIDLLAGLRRRPAIVAAVAGVAVNALLAGVLAAMCRPWLPAGLGDGLVVAALAPCTVASVAVWTRRGGGDESVALAITAVTNALACVTLPVGVAWLLAGDAAVAPGALAMRLAWSVLLPMAVGQLLRVVSPTRRWCEAFREPLGVAAQAGLLAMVFLAAVRSGPALAAGDASVGAGGWLRLLASTLGIHLLLFAAGWRLSRVAGAGVREALPAALGASQKTLAVGLSVAMSLGPLAVLPMIVYHATQLLADEAIVQRLRPRFAAEPGAPDSAARGP
ncbi:MAG: bile acid:sodium symporter [Planctomycetota bacterium]